jgi:hypothetical protein
LRFPRGRPAGLPERTGGPAVFAVFAGNYQRPLTFSPQKSLASGVIVKKITAGFGLLLAINELKKPRCRDRDKSTFVFSLSTIKNV